MPFIELTLDEMGLLLDPVVIVPSKKHRQRFYPTEVCFSLVCRVQVSQESRNGF